MGINRWRQPGGIGVQSEVALVTGINRKDQELAMNFLTLIKYKHETPEGLILLAV